MQLVGSHAALCEVIKVIHARDLDGHGIAVAPAATDRHSDGPRRIRLPGDRLHSRSDTRAHDVAFDSLAVDDQPLDAPDQCDEGELNEILWHAMKGYATPFPRWAVKLGDDD